jgi:hypothetical protein
MEALVAPVQADKVALVLLSVAPYRLRLAKQSSSTWADKTVSTVVALAVNLQVTVVEQQTSEAVATA